MPTSALLAKSKTRRKYTKDQKQTIKEKLLKQNNVTAEDVRETKNPKKKERARTLEVWLYLKRTYEIEWINKKLKIFLMHWLTIKRAFFYATNRIMKGLVKKARTSLYPKDKVFIKIFNDLDSDIKTTTSVINENPP